MGQLGSLLPHVVVPSILAAFLIPEWHLSGAQAGLLAGSGAAGYMLTVPVLATLTDRIDARKILIAGSALSALGTLLFGLFATGLWSGALFNAIAGVGFAGAYMPGPQGADRPPRAGRFIPRHHALHLELLVRRRPVVPGLAAGRGKSWLAQRILCHRARAAGDAGRSACCCGRSSRSRRRGRLLDFAPVFRNRKAMGFVLGYGAHCFELYGIRTWLVAFWTFVALQKFGRFDSDADRRQRDIFPARDARAAFSAMNSRSGSAAIAPSSTVMFASAAVALLIGLSRTSRPGSCCP